MPGLLRRKRLSRRRDGGASIKAASQYGQSFLRATARQPSERLQASKSYQPHPSSRKNPSFLPSASRRVVRICSTARCILGRGGVANHRATAQKDRDTSWALRYTAPPSSDTPQHDAIYDRSNRAAGFIFPASPYARYRLREKSSSSARGL